MKTILIGTIFLVSMTINAQETIDELPYASIPEAPATYTAGTVVARMIDGLGFRYRWATEGLTEKDFDYTPANEGRSVCQTLDHLYGLSNVILNSAKKKATDRTATPPTMTTNEKRVATLKNFRMASELFLVAEDLNEHPIIFKTAKGETEFPFWNSINGPIEDAVWHAGQVVVLRRSAGNPINPKVNVFLGKLSE